MATRNTETMKPNARLATWERRSEWPLALAALVFLAVFALPILAFPLSAAWSTTCDIATQVIWALFIVDYLVRVYLATERGRYVFHHLPDLLVLVLPMLRPLRLLRLITLLSVLNRRGGSSLRGRVAVYVSGATVLVLFVSSLAILDAERGASEANIASFGDALWWATTTVTTVGYGDRYPVTTEGRFVAVGLMLAGIALIGVVTASFATWLLARIREVEEASEQIQRADLNDLVKEVAQLRAVLESRAGEINRSEADCQTSENVAQPAHPE